MATSRTTPVIETQEGPIQGVVENDVFVFKGIPYAKPPVGSLRWRSPEAVVPWTAVRKADAYGPSSYQDPEACKRSGGGDPGTLSEDCLYLNVWTTPFEAGSPPTGRPVMVWIHGGAYVIGAGGLPIYIGAPLVKRGAVVITLNYRLGHLGFFAHPSLEQESPNGGPIHNFGLLDQIAALEWVQRNIEKFGGDPGNVTIFGQSAGGRSVMALCTIDRAKPLFHRAIAQSVYGLPDATREEALQRGVNVSDLLLNGRPATAAALRDIAPERFWRLTTPDPKAKPITNAPVCIAGDAVLPKATIPAFLTGQQAAIPLLLGNTSNDASVVLEFGVVPAEVIQKLREEKIDLSPLYPDVPKGDDAELGRQVCRDLLFTLLPREIADYHRLKPKAGVWRYYFDYTAEQLRPQHPNGVRHGDELPYTMGTAELCPPNQGHFSPADREFQDHILSYWFEFARTGKPAPTGSPEWPAHTLLKDTTMILGHRKFEKENGFMGPRLAAYLLVGGLRKIGALIAAAT